MVEMSDVVCFLVPLLMLTGATLQADVKSIKEAEKTGNFMEDEQWLSTISQYSRKIKHWNRFRDLWYPKVVEALSVTEDHTWFHDTADKKRSQEPDLKEEKNSDVEDATEFDTKPRDNRYCMEVEDDYVRSWDENQGSNDNVDTTKDPCQKVKCSRHKVCIAQGYQRAVCVNRKKLEHRLKQPNVRSPNGNCQPCPISSTGPVCGSDGHNYASKCKLEQQACLTGKDLTLKCSGLCPCPTAASVSREAKRESCTGQDLSDLGERLRDWFQLLQTNAKQNNNSKPGARTAAASTSSVLDRSLVASCKDSIGWMFSKLDTNNDLYLDQAELAAINLDKYEVCIRPFFNSCDSYRDSKVSTAEWCLCFWREKPPCLAELERIQVLDGGIRKFGRFIPSCNEDGYYRKQQCDRGECWCADQNGGEVAGSRIRGKPDCDSEMTYSGDFGSAVGWEDEEEKGAEETAEEAEEEEGEVGEVDDGGYIW